MENSNQTAIYQIAFISNCVDIGYLRFVAIIKHKNVNQIIISTAKTCPYTLTYTCSLLNLQEDTYQRKKKLDQNALGPFSTENKIILIAIIFIYFTRERKQIFTPTSLR